MQLKFLIIPAVLLVQFAGAQNGPAVTSVAQGTTTITPSSTPSIAPSTSGEQIVSTPSSSSTSGETLIMDYKSVYEAATVEEEVQMATERFSLTQAQQDIWLNAAKDRRAIEKQAYAALDSRSPDISRDAQYKALRTSHNNFYEAIVGYLNPRQKQALELDRAVLNEKQKRIAKLPPPPPPAPIVAPVDSAAIKEQILKEAEKIKAEEKKAKKKKKKA